MKLTDWSRIKTGETFEALVTALISFKIPWAALFGKRGPDGGQDVRSDDGRTVFQAKFHMGASAALALGDARNEADKIQDYRSPGHKNEPIWRGVTHWKLVTNAEFGPQNHQRRKAEIVPLFDSMGLVAEFWGRANLDSLLFGCYRFLMYAHYLGVT